MTLRSSLLLRPLFGAVIAVSALGPFAPTASAANPFVRPPGLAALPGLPGPNAAASAPASSSPSAMPPDGTSAAFDRVRRGLVLVERDGRAIGAGTVLANDGRVLTALSALGAADTADVRYADGHTVKARVGHRDPVWDLALLVPLSGRWLDGLSASEGDPTGVELRLLVPPRAGKATPTVVTLKGRADVKSKSGEPLSGALDVEVKGASPVGAPILDAAGTVVGVLIHARACKSADGAACPQITVGAPVSALRNFLVRTPLNAVAPSPWLGIVGAPDRAGNVHGVRVMAVAPQSPAEKGGLKTSAEREKADLIAAVDGQPVDTPEALADLIGKHAVGESVKLLVFGADKFRELTVVLRAAP